MSIKQLIESFKHAGKGLKYVFKTEQNFRIQLLAAIIALALAAYFPLNVWEFIVILLLAWVVLVMEMLNTALEKFSDLLKPRLHHYIHVVKDVMAGAVLLSSAVSLIIGLIIFLPHFIKLFK